MQFWALVVDSFRESLDRKIFWVMVAVTLIIAAAMVCVGFEDDHVSFLFGMWEIRTDHYSTMSGLGRSNIVGLVVYALMNPLLGWAGVTLMIIATAGAFPALMARGVIDVVLSKPISRQRLFIYKYLASMVFVLVQATLFVGVTFLIMGMRWGVWVPGYLLSIPLVVLLFSYVYCVSVLVAVRTRSTVAAILLSIGAWIAYVLPATALQAFNEIPSLREQERFYQMVRVAAWIPPKTADISYLAGKWGGARTSLDIVPTTVIGSQGEGEQEQLEHLRDVERREMDKSPVLSIGSSLLFEAVVVLWAMVLFTRKDY